MRRLLTILLAAMAFVACTQNEVEELTAKRADVPETLTVSFEGVESTRIELQELNSVWSAGDEVSVFYRSYSNLKYKFDGNSGDSAGTLSLVAGEQGEATLDKSYMLYPYSENNSLGEDGMLYTSLPAEQSYKANSYGVGGNILVAESTTSQFVLNNVCGWIRIQLTGDGEVVQSITLSSNKDETLAGDVVVNSSDAGYTLTSSGGSSITLDCGEGVTLSESVTEFYIGILPQRLEGGITVDIVTDQDSVSKSTYEAVVVERNHILPMTAFRLSGKEAMHNELRYTATALVEPYDTSDFNVSIISNEWDEATGDGVITFDGELTTIGEGAFFWCYSLTSVTIPDSVTTIGDMAFDGCDNLTSVTIPDSITTIGNGAFAHCDSLTSVTIPDSVTTIGYWVFAGCNNLAEFKGKFAADGGRCLIKDNTLIAYAYASGTTYTIPDSVTTIGDATFYGCDSLTSVYCEATTPPTLGPGVFDDNASGRKIYVPAESVGAYKAAENWSEYAADIVGYDFETGEEVAISNKLFYTATAKVEPYKASAFNVAIVSNEWDEETGEGVITFDGELTSIGDMALYNCDSLTSITIGDSVTTIGNSAFYWCNSLTSVTIPDSVTTIGDEAFRDCHSLTSVTIPDSVTTIGWYAFSHCFSLTSVTIGNSVTMIGVQVFYECTSLTSVTIPNSVTTIGDGAFRYCTSLTSVTIPDSVTTIGNGAFNGCDSLTSVTIPDSVTTIGGEAFGWCYSLTSVTIGDSVTTIGNYAFEDCSSLTSVVIPDSVTTIGGYAFLDCTSLTSVTIPDSVTTIGNGAFNGCDSLTSVTIPDSVTTIGEWAFENCDSLTSVTIPDSVTTIGNGAFNGCDSLTSVYCKATTPPTLGGSYVFYSNKYGRKIYVPAESVEAYKVAENWSEYASSIVAYDFE